MQAHTSHRSVDQHRGPVGFCGSPGSPLQRCNTLSSARVTLQVAARIMKHLSPAAVRSCWSCILGHCVHREMQHRADTQRDPASQRFVCSALQEPSRTEAREEGCLRSLLRSKAQHPFQTVASVASTPRLLIEGSLCSSRQLDVATSALLIDSLTAETSRIAAWNVLRFSVHLPKRESCELHRYVSADFDVYVAQRDCEAMRLSLPRPSIRYGIAAWFVGLGPCPECEQLSHTSGRSVTRSRTFPFRFGSKALHTFALRLSCETLSPSAWKMSLQ
jgi:hypothetical protein